MRVKRIILFFLMIAVGLGIGLLYGWIINPLQHANAPGSALRSDYKADYVLMVAEIYTADGKLDQAVSRLSILGDLPPVQHTAQAILTARSLNYGPGDLEILERLSLALQTEALRPENGDLR